MEKHLEMQTHGRSRTSWEVSIKLDVMETGCKGGRQVELAQDCVQWALMLVVMNIQVLVSMGLFFISSSLIRS